VRCVVEEGVVDVVEDDIGPGEFGLDEPLGLVVTVVVVFDVATPDISKVWVCECLTPFLYPSRTALFSRRLS